MSDEKPLKRPSRNPDGAPSKFKEEYCEKLIEHMAKPRSFKSFGGVIRVCEDTLHDWVKRHPSWAQAKKIGESMRALALEDLTFDSVVNTTEYDADGKPTKAKSVNQSLLIFILKNMLGWRDKQPDENDSININLSLADKLAKARARSGKK